MTENEAYAEFAHEIVIKAVEDWRDAIVDLRRYRKGDKRHIKAMKRLEELSDFFHSEWCGTLCGDVSPKIILNQLEKELMQL